MRNNFLYKGLMKNVKASRVNIACIFMIALLTGACASEYKQQASSYSNETGQVSVKGESENGEANDDQEIVCRTIVRTGSRFKEKICATKAEWAVYDKKNNGNTDVLTNDLNRGTRVNTGPSIDPMGGQSTGIPR